MDKSIPLHSREFEGYKLYQIAEPNHMIGTMVRPYQVGLRYVDAETNNGGVKRIKEIIGEDGTTRIEIWTLSVDACLNLRKHRYRYNKLCESL